MAWANKYRFRFDSVHGVEYNIYILKDGYSGGVIQRALGRAPVLKKKQNGPICGTSLELYAQCDVDGEFAELYTSDPKEYKVEVYRAGTLIWFGFVSTELYSEPSIAPPYDVQIVATDGLGELKLNNYEAQGEISLKALFIELLSYTGSGRDFYFATNLRHTGGTKQQMLSWTINIDFLDGKSCYDVLTQLLESLHATITTYNGRWLIARETDIETLLSNAGELSVVTCSASGTVSTAALSGVRKTIGQMGVANMWPNGNLSTAIEPARNRVVVKAPWHLVEAFQGADLTNATDAAMWDHDNLEVRQSILDPWLPATHINNGYFVGDTLTGSQYGFISRDIPMGNINGMSFDIDVTAIAETINPTNIWRLLNGSLLVYLKYTDTTGDLYWTEQRGWTTQLNSEYTDLGAAASYQRHELSFSVPPCTVRTTTAGTLTFYVSGRNFRATYANIALTRPEDGYQDTIYIDNGARGEASAVELIPSRALSDNIPAPTFYQGIWKYSGSILYSFEDSNNSNSDFMSLQALDRAISVALARTKTEGLVDVPSSVSSIPLIVRQGLQDSWVNTWDWDLEAEDVKISALSMPNAAITIDSEVVKPIEPGSGSSSGGGSSPGSGGSSSSSGGGVSLLRMWQSLTNNGELTDYDAETKIALEHLSSFFEINEYSTGRYAIKAKPTVTIGGNPVAIDGLILDGFLVAFGDDSGDEPGGGIDLDRVWESLTNNTDKPNVKINGAHIPTLSVSGDASATITVGADTIGIALSIAKGTDAILETGTDTNARLWSAKTLADYISSHGGGGSVNSLTVGTTNYTPDSSGIITIPAYPTALASPYALTFGSKTYDGSAAKTITASDLGALTAVPKATNSVIGGFQTGYSESGKNYAVQMSGDKAFVNVPWTDTVYTHPTNGANVTISAANGKVLSAITVNNLGHVTSVSSKTLATTDIPDLSGTYLPLTGGTLTGDLRLKTNNANYGSKLRFGDVDYCYLHEDDDDHLTIYADRGITISTGSNYGISVQSNVTLANGKTFNLGSGTLSWDSTKSCWKLTGNLLVTGTFTALGD